MYVISVNIYIYNCFETLLGRPPRKHAPYYYFFVLPFFWDPGRTRRR